MKTLLLASLAATLVSLPAEARARPRKIDDLHYKCESTALSEPCRWVRRTREELVREQLRRQINEDCARARAEGRIHDGSDYCNYYW